jgi:hypothetical protein
VGRKWPALRLPFWTGLTLAERQKPEHNFLDIRLEAGRNFVIILAVAASTALTAQTVPSYNRRDTVRIQSREQVKPSRIRASLPFLATAFVSTRLVCSSTSSRLLGCHAISRRIMGADRLTGLCQMGITS